MEPTSGRRRTYVPSGFVMRRIINPITIRLGGPTLVLRGRRTGKVIATPVPPLTFEGASYLVAGGGETDWVRNLRAAGEGELRSRASTEKFRAVELNGADRDRVVTAYRLKMGRRAKSYFDALPQPGQHPVFRIDPIAAMARQA